MRNYLLLFLLFCCGRIIGQHLVLGIVLDEAEQPVPLATIQIWRTNNDSTLLAAGYTDDEGRFGLEIKRQEPISVTASYLGCGTVRTEGGSTDFFSLQLQEEANVLAGVKVSSRRIIDRILANKVVVAGHELPVGRKYREEFLRRLRLV